MILIKHRINSIKELEKTKFNYGVEIDVRSLKKRLFLNHEPYNSGVSLDSFLKRYNHSFLVVNIKEEGIEFEVLEKLKKNKIKNFFLLDVTIPQILKILKRKKEKRIAIRISKYENLDGAMKLANKIDWVWVDTFEGKLPITFNQMKKLKNKKLKICLVSPELPMKNNLYLNKLKTNINKKINFFDAICTKNPNMWKL